MGHEFAGEVVELGSAVDTFSVGDKVVSPFTISCGSCWYCSRGLTSRCEKSLLFGSPLLDGAQAEYVRVPLGGEHCASTRPALGHRGADTFWPYFRQIQRSSKRQTTFPTSCWFVWGTSCPQGQSSFLRLLTSATPDGAVSLAFDTRHHASSNARKLLPQEEHTDAVVVVVGCGPVGICAITSASTWVKPGNLYAVDSYVQPFSRLPSNRLQG